VAVGHRSQVAVPPGTPVVDTEGMSVLPGLMDMHVHLMILGHADYRHWDTTYMSRFRDEIMPIAARQLLQSGVTTVRDLGAPLEEILHVKRRIERGEIPGPRLYVSGPFIQRKKEKELGTLAPGRLADVIAVRGDVLTHIDLLQRVDVVVKSGVRVK
jgi:imidazolonepropionase-like amidohydrolase